MPGMGMWLSYQMIEDKKKQCRSEQAWKPARAGMRVREMLAQVLIRAVLHVTGVGFDAEPKKKAKKKSKRRKTDPQ